MQKIFLLFGSLSAGIAVILGAMGAHALKSKIPTGEISADQLQSYETAVKYQMYHAIALILVFLFFDKLQTKFLNYSGWSFMIGTILFSGSIYLLATRNILGIENVKFLGPITPIGGLFFIAGWLFFFISAFKTKF